MRESKMHVLREYHRQVLERRVVEKEVMESNLMECKYSLTSSDMAIKIPQATDVELTKRRRGRPSLKKKSKSSSNLKLEEGKQDNLFFRITRRSNSECCEPFHVVYMKACKFDTTGALRAMLNKYQERCSEMKYYKDEIDSRL
jgi:hypothetical protein